MRRPVVGVCDHTLVSATLPEAVCGDLAFCDRCEHCDEHCICPVIEDPTDILGDLEVSPKDMQDAMGLFGR
jgi:hypothetical protein